MSGSGVVTAQLPKNRARLRAVDPHYCKHPKLIPIWKYKRFPDEVFFKFKGEHVIYYQCELCGTHVTIPEQ